MQRAVGASALMLSLCICLSSTGSAQEAEPRRTRTERTFASSDTTALLAAEIREIAASPSLSVAKKEKRIANAVRVATVAATAYQNDSGRNLDKALELASVASRAAPRFTEVIVNAVSFSPAISRIDGSAGQIRAAAFAAAKAMGRKIRQPGPALVQEYVSAPAPRRPKPADAEEQIASSAPEPRPRTAARPPAPTSQPHRAPPETDEVATQSRELAPAAPEMAGEYANNTPLEGGDRAGSTFAAPLAGNAAFHAKADVTVRHDDNVYLSKTNPTSDEIVSISPGVEFSFGQNSLAHGSLGYDVEFLRYVHGSAPSARLNHVLADFGYSSANLSLSAVGSYNQAYQNNRDVLVAGNSALVRSNSLSLSAAGEGSFTPKTSLKTGASYTRTEYPVAAAGPNSTTPASLIGNKIFNVPLSLYYKVTPKVDLSAGTTYSSVKPENGGPGGHDLYYNAGSRGEFTPKLTGEFSIGYRKRHGDNGTNDSLVGYNGAFNYEVTPKTALTLSFGRDFSTSATGESLHNSSYGLKLSTSFTPQWDAGLSVLYRQVDYGLQFFRALPSAPPRERKDNYWEETLSTSYLFSSWLTTTAGYTLRNNSSANNPGVEFSNHLLSLMMTLRY